MIIAMSVVWVVQPAVHEVIDVITVGYAFMSAVWPMRVRAPGVRRAARGIGLAHFDNMFVDMIFMNVMQMTIVEVIDMAMMAHSRVSTARTMLMSVIRMMLLVAGRHWFGRLSVGGLSSRWLPYTLPIRPSARTMTFDKTVAALLQLLPMHYSELAGRPAGVTSAAKSLLLPTVSERCLRAGG